ncbi:MAG: PAS domain-containing protein [Candidatus Hydrothermarchaeales archaeon]
MNQGRPLGKLLLRAMVDSIGEGIVVLDASYRIIFVNDALTKLMKVRTEGLLGKTCYTVFHNRSSVCSDCPVETTFATGEPAATAFHTGKTANGSTTYMELTSYPIKDSEGKVLQVVEIVKDIKHRMEVERKLREKSDELEMIFDNAHVGIGLLDNDMRYIRINRFMEDMIGLKSNEIKGEHCYDVVGEYRNDPTRGGKERICDACNIVKVLDTGDIHSHVREHSWGLITESTGVPVKNEHGEVVGVMEIIRDITKEKKLEEGKKKSEEKYRTLIETMDDGIAVMDKERKVTFCNKKFAEMMEYEVEEMLGMDVISLFNKENQGILKKELKKRAQGKSSVYEIEFTTQSRRQLPVLMHATPLLDKDEKHIGSFAVVTDMTEKKKLENELREYVEKLEEKVEERTARLREAQKHLKNVIDTIGEQICVIDRDLKIGGFNKVFAKHVTFPKEKISGVKCYKVIHGYSEEDFHKFCISCSVKQAFEFGKSVESIHEHEADDDIVYHECRALPMKNPDGEVYQVVYVVNDVTTKKKLEQSIIQAKDDAEFYIDLMSHDINNANTVALGMLELLGDSVQGEEKEYISKSLAAVKRSSEIINDVKKLQLVRHTRKEALQRRMLSPVLQEAITSVKAAYGDKVEVTYKPKKAVVLADDLIKDLFWNLLDNAAKYDPHSKVVIGVEVEDMGDAWRIGVTDRGRGVPDDMKIEIFERFRRLEKQVKGSGIGLYLAKTLVDTYGGKIWVENRVKGDHEKGSVFYVVLPQA